MHRICDSPKKTSLDSQNLKSEPAQIPFPSSEIHSKIRYLWKSIELEIIVSLRCIRILIVQKFQRKQFNLVFLHFQTVISPKLQAFIFHQGRHQKPLSGC